MIYAYLSIIIIAAILLHRITRWRTNADHAWHRQQRQAQREARLRRNLVARASRRMAQ